MMKDNFFLENMSQNINILADGIKMRLINEADAEFVVKLRTDKKLGKYISWTSNNIEDQIGWIKEYKKREAKQKEFYFIFEDNEHKPLGNNSSI